MSERVSSRLVLGIAHRSSLDHCITRTMGLLDSEAGKRRLLSVEIPVIEHYNEGRDPAFRSSVVRLGSTLVLRYRLKPGHNVYQLETRLVSSYPTVPPETRVLTPLKHCPHLLEGQTLCLWRQGSTRATSRWDPARFTCIFAIQAAWRGWPATRSGTRPANGRCPKRSKPASRSRTRTRRIRLVLGYADLIQEVVMAHLFQVGAGSGGMPVLDMLCRDPRITRVTLVEPDVYKPHNVERHLFPAVGRRPAQGRAGRASWLKERRPDLEVRPARRATCSTRPSKRRSTRRPRSADLGVCAADNEPAKYHFDALMRRHGKPWTLGEVLSGGIGGFVHWFAPGGPCYGCVASHLQRSVTVDKSPAPDYSQPGGPVAGDDHPGEQGVDPGHRRRCTPWSRSACWPTPPVTPPASPACC